MQYRRWLNYISGAYLLGDGHSLISRDYLTVKLWDMRAGGIVPGLLDYGSKNIKPVYSAQVTEYMDRNVKKLYEYDSLDDEFFVSLSPDSRHMVTGAYNKSAHVIDTAATVNQAVRCKFDSVPGQAAARLKAYNKDKRIVNGTVEGTRATGSGAKEVQMDCRKQVTLGCWAPLR